MLRKVSFGVSVAFLLGLTLMLFWFYHGLNRDFLAFKSATGIVQWACIAFFLILLFGAVYLKRKHR